MRKILVTTENFAEQGNIVENINAYLVNEDDTYYCALLDNAIDGTYRLSGSSLVPCDADNVRDGELVYIRKDDAVARHLWRIGNQTIVEIEGEEYIDISDQINYNLLAVDIQHGLRTEQMMLQGVDSELNLDTIYVDVEEIGHINQDYPNQPYTRIYEGTTDDGRAIHIEEVSPFFSDEQMDYVSVVRYI